MKTIMKGAVTLFAVLFAVVPGATAAENSPLGVSSNTTIEGASGLSNGILIAMLAQPNLNAADSQAAPNGGPLVRVSHKPSGSTNSALSLPAPRGKVIFEHHWSEGDIPAELEKPGGGRAGTRFANKKFRLGSSADGRYKIVTDKDTGAKVLDILVTREDEKRFWRQDRKSTRLNSSH